MVQITEIATEHELNPYAAPKAEDCTPRSAKTTRLDLDADEAFLLRQRAKLASSFRAFGILLAVIAFVMCCLSESATHEPFLIGISVGTAILSLWYFVAADRIIRGDRSVRFEAVFLSLLIIAGFPLFTGAGVRCLYRVRQYLWS